MKELLEQHAKSLVDHPDQVSIRAVVGKAIRVILSPAGMRLKKRFSLEILE